jgi:hypothetical protein
MSQASRPSLRVAVRLLGAALMVSVAGCGTPKTDQLRTVRTYEVGVCNSAPTTDPQELAALNAFKDKVVTRYFAREGALLTAANHEQTLQDSVLRQYRGPIYYYAHPRRVTEREAQQGITWIAMVFLHTDSVRTHSNSGQWSEWHRVRTRNFTDNFRTSDGLRRWQCLVGSEIAWAEVSKQGNEWVVAPQAISVYEENEFARLLPMPTPTQLAGRDAVEPLALPAGASTTRD